MALTDEEYQTALARIQQMPEDLELNIIGVGVFTKADLLRELQARTATGEKIAEQQIRYLRTLKR